jgi:integrase
LASFRKSGRGWRAEIFRKGIRLSETFETKAAAQAWAGQQEAKIISGHRGEVPNLTFGDLLERYEREVSAHKKGYRWERLRIKLILRDPVALAGLRRFSAVDVSGWRDRRLQAVSAPSVRREWNLLSHACNLAVKEWHWLTANPFQGVRRPKSARSRERLITDPELVGLEKQATTPMKERAYTCLLWALETGMRASEICGLREIAGNVATLEDTKNGTRRQVPLSARAVELWRPGGFGISPGTLDVMFREMVKAAGIQNLHFHDSRHTACVRLSKKLNMLQLARMLGIKDPRILMVYFNETAEDIAKSL